MESKHKPKDESAFGLRQLSTHSSDKYNQSKLKIKIQESISQVQLNSPSSKLKYLTTKTTVGGCNHTGERSGDAPPNADSLNAKQKYERLLSSNPANEMEELINDENVNSSNYQEIREISNFVTGDRFIARRNTSFEEEENRLKMLDHTVLDNSLSSEGVNLSHLLEKSAREQTSQYKGLLVTQLYTNQTQGNTDAAYAALGRERIDNSLEHQMSNGSGSHEQSEEEAKRLDKILPKTAQLPGRVLRFATRQNIVDHQQDESQAFGILQDNGEFVNKIFSVKRSTSLVKAKSEMKQSSDPKFKTRARQEQHKLPERPFKVLAAPDVRFDLYQNILDWSPQSRSHMFDVENQILALALNDTIYLVDPLKKVSSMQQIEFNRGRLDITQEAPPSVLALSFDREGEALAAGSDDALVSIFDVRTGSRIRNLNCHSKAVTAISWHRSNAAPYVIATGSADSTIVFHDVRAKVSVINQIRNQHEGQITKLEWSCNHSPMFMESTSESEQYLASASSLTADVAQLGIWSLRDILQNSGYRDEIKPMLWDARSHSSPIAALSWCPVKPGIFVTGGSQRQDSVIRLFDLSKLSDSTKRSGGIACSSHDDVIHSIKCNSEVTGLCWRKTTLRDDGFGDLELISTHGSPGCEVKLWQINKYKQSDNQFRKPLYINGKQVQYWFTKIEDWQVHEEEILDSILSPDSSTLATLSADETLRFWKMFETFDEVKQLKKQKRIRQGKRSQSEGPQLELDANFGQVLR